MGVGVRGARKVISALFADIVGSTALGETMDPEDFQEVIGDAVRRMMAAVEPLGGTVIGIAGDGLTVLFGVPSTREDDAERAVLAGLRIVESIAEGSSELTTARGIDGLAVRVGVETGLAVVGPSAADPGRWDARGDVLNTAARIQGEAAPGEVLVGPATYAAATDQFEWGETRDLTVKGKARTVPSRPVLAVRSAPPAPERPVRPLIGRERELAVVAELQERFRAGAGGVLLLEGEPGIGKSRLLLELRERLAGGEGARWLQGRCVSYGATTPYLPLSEPVRRCVAALEDGGPSLLGIIADRTGAAPDAASMPPETVRAALAQALEGALATLGGADAVVLAIEDVHWIDESSARLLERLVSATARHPILLALTMREDGAKAAAAIADAARSGLGGGLWEIRLGGLDASSEKAMLASLIGKRSLPSRLERMLLERAEGSPLFLEELVRSLIDAGALVEEDEGWRFEETVQVELSGTIDKVLLARLDRLAAELRDVVDAASVVGRHFEPAMLEEVLGVAGDELARALAGLERSGLVHGAEAHAYRFRHALIREVAYNSMLRGRRRQLHGAVAAMLEARFGDALEEHSALLAHHHEAAGRPAEAFRYHHLAAENAARIYAVQEALEHYGSALQLAGALDTADRAGIERLRLRRGVLLHRVGRYYEGEGELQQLLAELEPDVDPHLHLELLNELGFMKRGSDYEAAIALHEQALANARALQDARAQALTLSRLSLLHCNQLRFAEALELAHESLGQARRAGNQEARTWSADALKLIAWQLGDLGTLASVTTELIESHRESGDLWYLQWPLLERTALPLSAGDVVAAEHWLGEAIEINERIGDAGMSRVFLEDVRCSLERVRGDLGAALAAGRRCSETAEVVGADEWIGWAEATHGWVLLEMHAVEDAVRRLELGLAAAERAQARHSRVRCGAQLAWACALSGDRAQAERHLDRAEGWLAEVTTPPGRSWLFGAFAVLSVARVRLASGEAQRAEFWLRPILEAARDAPNKEIIARTATALAECRFEAGDPEEAGRLLEEALAACGEVLPGPARDAHATLATLTPDPTRSAAHRDKAAELTRRLAATIEDPVYRGRFLATSEERL